MTDREQVEATWKEYCDASKPTGVVHGTDVEEFDVDEMDRAALELHQLNLNLLRERDAAEALAYERAAEICTNVIKNYDVMKPDRETYEPPRVQKAAKGMVSLAREDIRALATSPNALAEHDAKVRAEAEAPLLELLRWVHETLWEINPSNYDHDDVCKLNAASVEVILGIAPTLGETHGKSPEWWAAREQAND
ncbi:hypothetical protein [uncultured Maritimibacter sp.]|uniref:hypothetical protein n=1 Tax=uncultured Maritimibacter sp. TaxID=991866 RepID=UPI002593BF88|nr:hypothetical protein [uncultured Maritimibacter sp.]